MRETFANPYSVWRREDALTDLVQLLGTLEISDEMPISLVIGLFTINVRICLAMQTLQLREEALNLSSAWHKIIYRLNGYVVQPESNYYKDLEVIFQELKKQDWKLSSGYEISSKLDEVTEYVSGKKKQSYEFAKGTYCDRGSLKCTYYGGGTLRVPKGSL